jgi:hypothetical protein
MCEVENLVNSRPITKVSSDSNDPSALTPNHLILLKGSPSSLLVVSCPADAFRRRWRQVQHLADVFWSRWLKEYVPMLQKTTKWHESKNNLSVNDVVLVVDEHVSKRSMAFRCGDTGQDWSRWSCKSCPCKNQGCRVG